MTLAKLRGFAKDLSFNDIEWWDEPSNPERLEELIGHKVPGLAAFAEHGSASLYATWQSHVVWLDSEGEQFVIAKSIADFVVAMHFEAGAVYDVISACAGDGDLKEIKARFTPAYLSDSQKAAGENYSDHAAFVEWASSKGIAPASDLPERVFALRPMTTRLRAVCGGEEQEDDEAEGGASGAQRYEFTEDGSSKFWEIRVEGSSHTVRFGKIGTDGQSKSKDFDDDEAAEKDAQKLVAEKTKKGYVKVDE